MWGDAVVVGLGTLSAGTFAANLPRPGTALTSRYSELSYVSPLVDIVLLALILSTVTLTGCRIARPMWWVSTGLALVAVGDLAHLLILPAGHIERAALLTSAGSSDTCSSASAPDVRRGPDGVPVAEIDVHARE
jgi:hypothetical protein